MSVTHPDLDGPFSVPTAWTTQTDPTTGASYQVATAFADNRWNTTPGFYAAHLAALSAYRVTPAAMARVWAGDDPANPHSTVALAFPDAQTAESVLLSCGAPVTDSVTGQSTTPITGYQPGVVFVIPTENITPDLQPYSEPVPTGVPVLDGVDCVALSFTDEEFAKVPLATYWENDL